MNTFNLALVVNFLVSFVPSCEIMEIEQVKGALSREFGVTVKTAAKWRERALNSGEVEKVIGGVGYKLVDKEQKKKQDRYFKNKDEALKSDKIVNIKIARFKRSKFYKAC